MLIPNYQILEELAESHRSSVFKAYHKKSPDQLLVLKVLVGTLSHSQRARFKQKTEQLKVLNDPQVITPISFESKDDISFITYDYFPGTTLDKWLQGKVHGSAFKGSKVTTPEPLNLNPEREILNDFFSIACSLARILDNVHQSGIIHGGVKPRNILLDPDTHDIRLIDFLDTVEVTEISHFIYERSFIRGTLSYTSPEQTGRINHRVVFSSDLYSLGVVFYEMLTGHLPFSSEDPLELIHSHLAKEAQGVHESNPGIPAVLGKIVAKLMLKEPEKRYQNSRGLLSDLVRCRDEYLATGAIREFSLESRAHAYRVGFVSKMVGRDKEADLVLEEYERVAGGVFRSLFISGLPGIGKTRLVQELQKPMVKHKGYFTSGKFDVYQKNIPYSSLTQALRNLIRTFLTESDERVALWKDRILKAVGQDGKVMTDVIQELDVLIGRQPEVAPLPPVESLLRFHDLFGRFLTCLATKENPLILFIDDLQWCDAASFDFLAEVFNNSSDHPYLFFLGAYRHNEVDAGHPLSGFIRNSRDSGHSIKEIRLDPLKPEHCHEMVSYILDSPPEQTKALADFISALTEGNPLFVSESLAYLYSEGLLHLDGNNWQWDIDKIRESRMPTTVVALFSSKILKLPPDLGTLLEYCACIGNTFSPAELASIREMSLQEIFEMLKPALQQGLVIEDRNRLRFVHDRVQEAALSAIPPERRRRIHWQVGTCLRAAISGDTTDYEKLDNLFAIVAHLNLGMEEKPDHDTAYFVSDLNYHAGNKALDSLAVEAANRYFNTARELLPDDLWDESNYLSTFSILRKAAKTELMCGNHEKSERLLDQLLGRARTDLDRAECLAEQTVSLSSIGNFVKAIETANRGLAYFGKSIPDSLAEVKRERERLIKQIAAKEIDIRDTLLNMPFTMDTKKKVESAFYSELLADLYFSGRVEELYFVAAQATLHCLEGGMDEGVIYAFTAMGIYHAEQEEFERSFLYEDLTHDLAAKYPNTFAATKCMNGATWTLMHTRNHPRDIVNYSLKALQCGRNCGDINNAAIAYGPAMWNLQVQGGDLTSIEDYAGDCLRFATRYHVPLAARLAEATLAGWVAPMKKDYSHISMEEKLKQWEQDDHAASLCSYFVHKALSHYYFEEYEETEIELVKAEKYLLSNNVLKREWHVFRVLNALKLYEKGAKVDESQAGTRNLERLALEIQPIIQKIEKWASFGPLFKPYLAFIYAELARITGVQRSMGSKPNLDGEPSDLEPSNDDRFTEVRNLYLDAIDAASLQGYTFLAGHLNECLGELLLHAGRCSEWGYFNEAARLYRQCRAERKEIRLAEKYSRYFEETKTSHSMLGKETSSSYTLPNIDVDYLMKSSFTISAEIEQDALLKKIMNVVIASSGAQHGYLLIEEKGNLIIRAESHIAGKHATGALNQKLENADTICKAIVRYVHRTGERVILKNAVQEGLFKDNAEVRALQLRSVLCLEVVKQARKIGVLYLENRLADSVFTPERTQMTELLTSQAAISFDNARLMKEMREAEHQVKESLKEKEALLKEIHHRVKNNLQIIYSMLNLQLPQVKDEKAIELFRESQNRVHSMALIHEKLYQSESLAKLNLDEYVRSLIANLFQSYGVSERIVEPRIAVENISLDIDTVIPCALIINELVSNSLKHAFPHSWRGADWKGKICVDLRRDIEQKIKLTVGDNGIGLPKGIQLWNCESLGLKLVKVLVKQIRGAIQQLGENGGAEFLITFEPKR
ncbi:MAG: GAF domain-containing protein [Desulfobacteraceae bacterium]|nr:MAG: GAF domain-containing protein [Desulfobacteraceae bacterium]